MTTQNKKTLASWFLSQVKQCLDILEKHWDDLELRECWEACCKYIEYNGKIADIIPILKKARQTKLNTDENPIIQACACSIGTACALIQTPTNALGWIFYAAAAILMMS